MKEYKSKEFYLCATLMTYGFNLIGSERHDGNVFFILNNIDENMLNKFIKDFETYDVYVNVKKFSKAQAELRRELDKYKR